MNTEHIRRLEILTGRKLSGDEVARLGRIQSVLNLTDNDALWDVLAALEYQRTFYEALPAKVAAASTEILQGISDAAKAETQRAQSLLTKSVVEQAQKLSVEINMGTLLPLGLVALICLLAYGSLLMWAGYSLATRNVQEMALVLRMPSGFLMGGLCLAGGLFLGVYAVRQNIEEENGWWKTGVAALVMFSVGVVVALFAVQ